MIYYIGLIVVCLTILISIDDVFWDLFYLVSKLFGYVKDPVHISSDEMESVPPKMMALIIAAYREEDVIEAVLRNLLRTTNYPAEMMHIFIGVYPNDPATTGIIEGLNKEFPHVHPVVHYLNGPSSKADNINNVLEYTKEFEQKNKIKFKFYVIHDSEDIVHPYEFHLENYLMETHSAVQIPVFPLQEKPRLNNIFKNMVVGTYADEFAENHYQTMKIRNTVNAFVPSAGTGFAIKREVIDAMDGDVFPVGSLTEDYKLSLQFKRLGYHLYYPLEHISRVNFEGKEVIEYIATRSMFPRTYKAAVRQKTRWIHGITMQSFRLRDLINDKRLNLQTRYSFYKDWKAKFANLLVLPSYLVFCYFIASYFIDLPVMFPTESLSWYLMIALSLTMIHRQIFRFRSVYYIYGLRSATIATFLPPVIPLRLFVGNVINFHATVNAWNNHLRSDTKKQNKVKVSRRKKKVTWSKTDHEFLDNKILDRFRMRVGDRLLSKHLISSKDLKKYIELSYTEESSLRAVLIKYNVVDELDVIEAVSLVIGKTFYNGSFGNYIKDNHFHGVKVDVLKQLHAVPLFLIGNRLTIIASVDFDVHTFNKMFPEYEIDIICTSNKRIEMILEGEPVDHQLQAILNNLRTCIDKGFLTSSQAMIALKYSNGGLNIKSVLHGMGLLVCDEVESMALFI